MFLQFLHLEFTACLTAQGRTHNNVHAPAFYPCSPPHHPCPQPLAQHGITPAHQSYRTAFSNTTLLHECFKVTGNPEDQQRFEDARRVLVELHVSR